MNEAEIDPVIARLIEVLYSSASIDVITRWAVETYLEEMERGQRLQKYRRLISEAVKESTAALPQPAAGLSKVLLTLLENESDRFRHLMLQTSVQAAILAAKRATDAKEATPLREIRFTAAVNELERARGLLEYSDNLGRDTFAVNLVEAFCLSRISGAHQDAKVYFLRCVELLQNFSRQLSQQAEALEPRAKEMRETVARLRSYYGEDKLNESGARLELGRVTPNDPRTFFNEPVNVVAQAQAVVDEYSLLREREDRFNRVIAKLRAACEAS